MNRKVRLALCSDSVASDSKDLWVLAYLCRETLNGICLNHVFVRLLTLVGAEFACGVLLACSAN